MLQPCQLLSTLLAEHFSQVDIVRLLLFCVPCSVFPKSVASVLFKRVATGTAEDGEEDGKNHEDVVACSAAVSDTDEQET